MKYLITIISALVIMVGIYCINGCGYFPKKIATISNNMKNELTNEYFSVDIPIGWIAVDLTQNKEAQANYGTSARNITGFRPEGREVLFQHAIIVTDDSVQTMESVVMDMAKQKKYSLMSFETEKIRIPTYDGITPTESFVFENDADSSDHMSFSFFSKNGRTYVFLINDSGLDRSTHVPFDGPEGVFEKSFKFTVR